MSSISIPQFTLLSSTRKGRSPEILYSFTSVFNTIANFESWQIRESDQLCRGLQLIDGSRLQVIWPWKQLFFLISW